MKIIIAQNLGRKLRNGTLLIHDINMSVEAGEILTIQGENGAGKTVLLKALLGLTPSTGQLIVNQKALKFGEAYPIKAGILIESPSLINEFTAFQNLKLLAALIPQTTDDEIVTLLSRIGLDPHSKAKVKHFSLGMKEKLGIAQALLGHNELIVLDEPTNALDEESKWRLAAIIKEYAQSGCTFLIASHDQEFIDEVATRSLRMKEGHLDEQQTA